jgi:hypothetical protein
MNSSIKISLLKKTIFAAGAVMVLGSCKKFLDQQPITAVGPDFVFSNVSTAYQALAGVYSKLPGDNGYGIRISLYYPVDNDEMQGPTGTIDDDRRGIARYGATSSNTQTFAPFTQLFQGIEYANICIDNIPKMAMYAGGTDKEKKQLQRMLGEALTLRAQFYFEAIRNWGDLPAQFQPAYALAASNPFPKRVGVDTLYDQLLADLKTAADLVPWRNEITTIGDQVDERLTKGTVKGLRARIALFRGGYWLRIVAPSPALGVMKRNSDYLKYYQIAKDECNDIIASTQHTLNPSYRALWKDQVCAHTVADPQGELMFQVSGIGGTGAEDTKLGYYNGPTVNALGNKSINVLPTYFYLFDSTDLRRDVTCAPYIVNADGATKTGQNIVSMNDGKFRRDWITNPVIAPTNAVQYFGLKWQILRYADVLLMYAEADNEINGPTAAAYNAVNMVRRRGFGKPITTVDASIDLPTGLGKTDFFKYVVRERALELGGEGERKFDLIRWNLLATAIAETKTNMTNMSNLTGAPTYSYMASAPAYINFANLPTSMYFKTNATADDYTAWANSLYNPAPTSTPTGTSKITWLGTAGTTNAIYATALARFATNFVTGKGELLPVPNGVITGNFNFTQNPGY